jgi:hypothetical protein
MARTATVVWSVIGAIVLVLGLLAAIYGPQAYREGRALVGPIVEMAQIEERLAVLDAEFPFTPSEIGDLDADRFDAFLSIRRELLPAYIEWTDRERDLERQNDEDWGTAKEVLGAVREVMALQIDTLRSHGMGPAEFVWIEDLVYGIWQEASEERLEEDAIASAVRALTAQDLELLNQLEREHGSTAATNGFQAHLEQRLDSIDNPGAPVVDGVAPATSELLWANRNEIAELDFVGYDSLHDVLRSAEEVRIEIGNE